MGTTYNGLDALHTSIVVPSDGESGVAAINPGLEDLTDSIVYLSNRLIGSSGGWINIPLLALRNTNSKWTWSDAATPIGHANWIQSDVTGSDGLYFAVPNFHNCTIRKVKMTIKGSGSHGGVVATPPRISINQTIVSTGAYSSIGSWVDADTAVPSPYETWHEVESVEFVASEMSDDRSYVIRVNGEHDANSQTGLQLSAVAVKVYSA